MTKTLFSSVRLGDLTLANRIAMAPMTRNRSPDGVPTDLNALYYGQRASGLIITEGTTPDAGGRGYIDIPACTTPRRSPAGARWPRPCTQGGRIVVQIMHTGRISHPDFLDGALPVAPSAVASSGEIITKAGPKPMPVPRALEAAEIPAVIATYGRAAAPRRRGRPRRCRDPWRQWLSARQFLSTNANLRTDEWGRVGREPRALPAWRGGRGGGGDRAWSRRRSRQPGQHFQQRGRYRPRATLTHLATALAGQGAAICTWWAAPTATMRPASRGGCSTAR